MQKGARSFTTFAAWFIAALVVFCLVAGSWLPMILLGVLFPLLKVCNRFDGRAEG